VILAYRDTDLPEPPPPYVLKLPNEERNVEDNVAAIRAFVERQRGARVSRDEVIERMTVGAKERARLAFLQRVADGDTAS
jgi:hypothetical protein